MAKYVLDSYAWIEYFIASAKGGIVKEIIENRRNEIITSVITVAEVCGKAKKENEDVNEAYTQMLVLSKIEPISPETAKQAGIVKQEMRKKHENFGLADAIILVTARAIGAKVLTGDRHFKGVKEAQML